MEKLVKWGSVVYLDQAPFGIAFRLSFGAGLFGLPLFMETDKKKSAISEKACKLIIRKLIEKNPTAKDFESITDLGDKFQTALDNLERTVVLDRAEFEGFEWADVKRAVSGLDVYFGARDESGDTEGDACLIEAVYHSEKNLTIHATRMGLGMLLFVNAHL